MIDRRDFISAGAAAFLCGAAQASRTPAPAELAEDATPGEIERLRRLWGFWLDPPAGYSFRREHRLVGRYSYSNYDAELYLQRNGPEQWHWQRVLKVFPKRIARPLAAVGIPFYYVEAMLGHELDDETAALGKFTGIAQAAQLARRGYMAITCDLTQQNYVKYGVPPPRDHWDRFRDMSFKLAEDWPMWSPHAHRVFATRLMLDLLEGDERVDPSRIGMTGHSLGGQTGFYAGCLDPRVKAIMASDFAFQFDESCWDVLHYWGGKLPTVRGLGLENHTLLTLSGAKPFCLLAGLYDDERSYDSMRKAKGYKGRPDDLRFIHHATGHRPPKWALDEGYDFLASRLASPPAAKVPRDEQRRIECRVPFEKIERDVLPEAERHVAAIPAPEVMGLKFGAKPKARAFSEKGELRFDLGICDGGKSSPFDPPILFPLDVELSGFSYPKEAKSAWRNVYAHYTPVTRRMDYVEVHDYFLVSRFSEGDIRAHALGRLAAAAKRPGVETSSRLVRYAEQHLVVTGIRSSALAAAGRAEDDALRRILAPLDFD